MSKFFKPSFRLLAIYIFVVSLALIVFGFSIPLKGAIPGFMVGAGISALFSSILFFFVRDNKSSPPATKM